MKQSKRVVNNSKLVDITKVVSPEEAIKLVKSTANTKFVGSVECHVRTGIDPKKSDQAIRGSVSLPHGTGKVLRIAAFVTEGSVATAKANGATVVGGEELIKEIKETGRTDFDVAIAETAMMPKLAQIAKILGTRGLMPNPKTGTVGPDVSAILKEIAGGRVNFKNDDTGNVHAIIGKTDFSEAQLLENFQAFFKALQQSKPTASKGQFIISSSLNATMGPGIRVKG